MFFDCHLDLAMNAVHWNRDLTKSLVEIREREADMNDKPDRGASVVCFDEMRAAQVRFCVATQIGHSVSQNSPLSGWNSPEIAWAQTQAQLAWYQAMISSGELIQICSAGDLQSFRKTINETKSIAFVLSLEGADSLVDLGYLDRAHQYGLRIIGPAHYGPGRYAAGTGETDGLTLLGRPLLEKMSELEMILDVTHLTDRGFDESLDFFAGPILASHHNCRTLVDHQRQLTDRQIRHLIDRQALIGVAMDAWMLVPGWERGKSTPQGTGVSLQNVADHIDHICQIAGDCHSVAIGTDLDGGYGFEQTPLEIDSIAKLVELRPILEHRGYRQDDLDRIFIENAFQFFDRNLPS